jgi:hypothetical protein
MDTKVAEGLLFQRAVGTSGKFHVGPLLGLRKRIKPKKQFRKRTYH